MKEINILIVITLVALTHTFKSTWYDANRNFEEKEKPTLQKDVLFDSLKHKGIGPIKEITLNSEINQAMANEGENIYALHCTACHKLDKRFIGPATKGIFEKRSPEWIMNMILNPEEMMQKDSTAMALLEEYNGIPMPNQELTTEEARAILEYFRTLIGPL